MFYCYGIFYHTSMVYLAINYHPADEVTIFLNFELFEISRSRERSALRAGGKIDVQKKEKKKRRRLV